MYLAPYLNPEDYVLLTIAKNIMTSDNENH